MKLKHIVKSILFLVPSVSYAGVYMGASVGQTDSSSGGDFAPNSGHYIYTVIQNENYDSKDTGFSVFFGNTFKFPELNLSTEAGYIDFGQHTYDASGYNTWDPTGNINIVAKANASGIYVSGILKRVINKSFGVYGRFGATSWSGDAEVTYNFYDVNGVLTNSDSESFDDSGTDPNFGIGIQYQYFTLEYSIHKIFDTNTNYLNFGFKY